jgi:hypothetical protein
MNAAPAAPANDADEAADLAAATQSAINASINLGYEVNATDLARETARGGALGNLGNDGGGGR